MDISTSGVRHSLQAARQGWGESKVRFQRGFRYYRLRRKRNRRNAKLFPKYANCLNCGSTLQGMYCHKCGQYALDTKQSFGKQIIEYASNAYSYDGRLVSTLRYLFTRPGFLSSEFEKGRINSYMHPVKLYMFLNILFFTFIITLIPALQGEYQDRMVDKIEQKSNIQDSSGLPDKEEISVLFGVITHSLTHSLPFILIVLIPIYAGILRFFYRKRKVRYMTCLAFTMHIQAAMLLLISMVVLIALVSPFEKLNEILYSAIAIYYLVYLIIAAHSTFKERWWKSFVKAPLSFIMFWLVCVIVFITVFVNDIYEITKTFE